MESKSLRTTAKELGVSHSYLSQVINGKRPASEKVLTTLLTSGLIKNELLRYNEPARQRSSVVEQGTHKPLVAGSIPAAATFFVSAASNKSGVY
jgi:transcriptional regulator with XRE-family HTH domain